MSEHTHVVIGEGFCDDFGNWQFQYYVETINEGLKEWSNSEYKIFVVGEFFSYDDAREKSNEMSRNNWFQSGGDS